MEDWKQEHIDLLSGFVQQTLPASEMVAAQQRYQSEDNFRADVEEMKNIIRLAEEMEKAEIRSAVREVSEAALARPKGWQNPKTWLPIAASILFLAVVGYFMLRPNLETRVFTSAFEPLKSYEVFLGDSGKAAYQLYDAADYAAAISAFDAMTIETDSAASHKSRLFKGISLLASDQFQAAEQLFAGHLALPSITMESYDYYENEQWYYGLALLRNGKIDAAKTIFKLLVDSRVEKIADQAQDALDRLE